MASSAAPPSNNWRKSPLPRSTPKSGLLGVGTKGYTDPPRYLKELFTAIRDTDAEKFEDLHARFPLVKAKLDAPKNYKAKTCHVHAAKLGGEVLEDLMKFRLGAQKGEPYPQTWQESKTLRDKYITGFRAIRIGACDDEDELGALIGEAAQAIEIHLGTLWRNEQRRRENEMADKMIAHFVVATAQARNSKSTPGNPAYEGSLQQRLDRLYLDLPAGSPIGPAEVARLKALGKWGEPASINAALAAAEENMQKKYGKSRGGKRTRGRKSKRAVTRRN